MYNNYLWTYTVAHIFYINITCNLFFYFACHMTGFKVGSWEKTALELGRPEP